MLSKELQAQYESKINAQISALSEQIFQLEHQERQLEDALTTLFYQYGIEELSEVLSLNADALITTRDVRSNAGMLTDTAFDLLTEISEKDE